MNNESSKRRATIVGFFIFIGTSFFIAGILMIGNISETFSKKIDLHATFSDVDGLKKGNNIWFSGVKIGTIKSIEFTEKAEVRAHLLVDVEATPYIKKDAKVKISSDGFLGNKILVIFDGSPEADIVENGDKLAVEYEISTDEILNTLQSNNENILKITSNLKTVTSDLANGVGTIGKLLKDTSLYVEINSLSKNISHSVEKANGIISNIDDVVKGLNNEDALLGQLSSDTVLFASMQQTILRLDSVVDGAQIAIANLNNSAIDTSNTLGTLISHEETATSLKNTINSLESSSQKLDENMEALQHSFLLRRYFKKKKIKVAIN